MGHLLLRSGQVEREVADAMQQRVGLVEHQRVRHAPSVGPLDDSDPASGNPAATWSQLLARLESGALASLAVANAPGGSGGRLSYAGGGPGPAIGTQSLFCGRVDP